MCKAHIIALTLPMPLSLGFSFVATNSCAPSFSASSFLAEVELNATTLPSLFRVECATALATGISFYEQVRMLVQVKKYEQQRTKCWFT